MIRSSSTTDAAVPFIFQLPATKGRRATAISLPGRFRSRYQTAGLHGRGRGTFPAVNSRCCGEAPRSL
jgi:hypothetical protein